MERIVTVKFLFEGEIRESENEMGLLIGDKVLLNGGQVSLYNAQKTEFPDTYVVDLDNDGQDLFATENVWLDSITETFAI